MIKSTTVRFLAVLMALMIVGTVAVVAAPDNGKTGTNDNSTPAKPGNNDNVTPAKPGNNDNNTPSKPVTPPSKPNKPSKPSKPGVNDNCTPVKPVKVCPPKCHVTPVAKPNKPSKPVTPPVAPPKKPEKPAKADHSAVIDNDNGCISIIGAQPYSAKTGEEYIKIKNDMKMGINLKNFKIHDVTCDKWITLPSFSLKSGATVTIYSGSGANTKDKLYLGLKNHFMNKKDKLELVASEYTV
jgi:hypothetical protein